MLHLLPALITVASLATSAFAGPVVKVSNSGVASAIPDQYIVVFKDGITDLATDAHTRRITSFQSNIEARDPKSSKGRKRTRGIRRRIRLPGKSNFKAYTGEFDKDTVAEILKSPEVSYVEQDVRIKVDLGVPGDVPQKTNSLEKRAYRNDTQLWNLDRISHRDYKAPYWYYYNETWAGDGVTAYVIDTGIDKNHWQFRHVSGGYSRVRWGTNTIDDDNTDGNGHGTHCAGTIGGLTYGIVRNVSLVAVKVLDKDGYGSWGSVIAGIDWVARDAKPGYAVASLSLGGDKSNAVNRAIDALHAAGVTVVVASGNENDNASNYSPASASKAIAVGAIDEDSKVAEFSNYGSKVEFLAPGVNILSSVPNPFDRKANDTYSGTSMAAPHVAGLAAYFITKTIKEKNTGVLPNDLKPILISNSFTVSNKVLGKYRRNAANRIAGNNHCDNISRTCIN